MTKALFTCLARLDTEDYYETGVREKRPLNYSLQKQ